EVPEELVVQFPDGLPGFEEEKKFAFLPYDKEENSPFAYMQSVQDPDLTLLLADPFLFFKHYSLNLNDEDAAQLGLSDSEETAGVYGIVAVPEKIDQMTVNLVAPIVVNWKEQKGMQIILDRSPYSTKHRLFPLGLPQQQTK
ncbi:MAG: flagellar assembly protein FliW, partial [Anaeromusa sp.]|uniref:flagellar assembly protein FliW n=1 Tax=Anaeromusa sp. TaxID=1872520 RepID=UPI002B1F957D